MNNIAIPTSRGTRLLCLQHIIRIQSCSNYSIIYFADNSYPLTVAKVLLWFEEHLPKDMFVRTHRSHLVNRLYVKHILPSLQVMQLTNGDSILISKRRKQPVKQQLCA